MDSTGTLGCIQVSQRTAAVCRGRAPKVAILRILALYNGHAEAVIDQFSLFESGRKLFQLFCPTASLPSQN